VCVRHAIQMRSVQCSSGSVGEIVAARNEVPLIRTRMRWIDRWVWEPAEATGCWSKGSAGEIWSVRTTADVGP